MDVEFAVDVFAVVLHGVLGEIEMPSDVGNAAAFAQLYEHVGFAVGESFLLGELHNLLLREGEYADTCRDRCADARAPYIARSKSRYVWVSFHGCE